MNQEFHLISPTSQTELLARCKELEGLSFSQLSGMIRSTIPADALKRKGWAGQALETALGAHSGSKALPDFNHLGIELKTIPFNASGKPAESTFVTHIPLLTIQNQTWKTSTCFKKLEKVLWIPVEGDQNIPFHHRRIGRSSLWSPDDAQETVLEKDWNELTTMIATGRLEEIHAGMGEYLQIRPKAANSKALCHAYDQEGRKIMTMPRGFYLRSLFTAKILS